MRLIFAMIACLVSPRLHLGAKLAFLSRTSGLRMMSSSARPSLDDVERISRGQAAKRRGTGSRGVPHRLNQMERAEWDLAKKRRYLMVRGTGYRRERGDSPLINIYRQLCDSLEIPSISVQRGVQADGSELVDIVTLDLSPLRTLDIHELVAAIKSELGSNKANYPSLLSCSDNTAVGVEAEYQQLFRDEVIWRIPAINIVCTFGQRQDSKRLAEWISRTFAGGQKVTRTEKGDDVEEDD